MRIILSQVMHETYVIHNFELLPAHRRAIVENHRLTVGKLGNVGQPHLEKTQLDQDQLIVLT